MNRFSEESPSFATPRGNSQRLTDYEKDLELPPKLRVKPMTHQIDSKNLSFEVLPSGDVEVKTTREHETLLIDSDNMAPAETVLLTIPKEHRAALAQFLVES